MKSLIVLVALNVIKNSQQVPIPGGVGVSGGFVKQGGFAVGPAVPSYAEGYGVGGGGASGGVVGGGGGFEASFGGVGGIENGGGAEVVKTITVEKHVPPPSLGFGAVGGGSLSLFGGGPVNKHVHVGRAEVISEKVLEVVTEAPLPPPPAKKTVIERTFIPNYVEKRVQVPTYVEKTIRVPTFVEKTIKVPAAPTILEKTISQEDVPAPAPKEIESKVKVEGAVRVRPHKVYHKEVIATGGGGAGYLGGSDFIGAGQYGGASGFGNGYGGGGFQAHVSGGGRGLLDGIFNIPIQALGATKEFLNNFSGGVSAQGGFAKGYSAY